MLTAGSIICLTSVGTTVHGFARFLTPPSHPPFFDLPSEMHSLASVSYVPLWFSTLVIIKIPLIILETIGLRISTLAPNPTPHKIHQVRVQTTREISLRILMRGGAAFIRNVYLIGGVCEVAILIACIFPTWTYSPIIVQYLSFSDTFDTSQLHLNPMTLIGTLSTIQGSVLRWWCYQVLGRHFTYELSLLKDHRLVTEGPYTIVRHPAYTGGLMSTFGAVVSRCGRGTWLRESGVLGTYWGASITLLWVFVTLAAGIGAAGRAREEDAFMSKEFGKAWDEWADRVPYRILPGLF